MVGVGEDGKESSLARASVVDFHGRVVLDEVRHLFCILLVMN